MAQINHEPEISRMVCALATMFRYTTVQHGDLVTIDMELTHVHNYLEVQRPSYDDQIVYEELVPKALREKQMPKLILQPLIENCFNHGFDSANGIFHIQLRAYQQGPVLTFEISDDGMGMDAEKLRAIQESLSQPLGYQSRLTSIGLSNIHNRLRLTYGPESGIAAIDSKPGGGATITLVIHEKALPDTCNQLAKGTNVP